jgi:hypothetical protein
MKMDSLCDEAKDFMNHQQQRSKRLDWAALVKQTPPPRVWAIYGWLGFGHNTLLVGGGGSGKTLIAQQMCSALHLGRPFIDEVKRPLTCLMWACEDDHDELWRRQVAIAKFFDVKLDAFNGMHVEPRLGLDAMSRSVRWSKCARRVAEARRSA